ncbi:hypothetical protein Tco_0689546 [Tanacetum coccineum]
MTMSLMHQWHDTICGGVISPRCSLLYGEYGCILGEHRCILGNGGYFPSVLYKKEVKGTPNVIRKVSCLGGMPTSDALTIGLKTHPECVWMSDLVAVREM